MSNNAAESINFKVVNMTQPDRKNEDCRMITLDKVYAWIDKKEYDESIKNELKKMVAKYPNNAYVSFGKNFQKHLVKAQAIARKTRPLFVGELGDDNYMKLESLDAEFVSPQDKKTSKVTEILTKQPTSADYKDLQADFENEEVQQELNPILPNGLKELKESDKIQ